MKKLTILFALIAVSIYELKAQTNTPPLPNGNTKIGEHLTVGNSNEIWSDASNLYFNYRGNAIATHFWNKNGSTGASVLSILSNGNVGIGTTTPNKSLHIVKTLANGAGAFLHLQNNTYSATSGATTGIRLSFYGDGGSILRSGIIQVVGESANQGHPGRIALGFDNDGTYTERVSILNDGKVGIGTITPTAKLHIFQTGGTQVLLESGDAQSSVDVQLRLKTAIDYRGRGIWMTYASSTGDWFAGVPYTGGGYSIGYHATQPEYKANSALFISTDRNVGIGITNPQNKLDVAGTIRCTEVKVEALPWADFVFHPTYKLRTLGEVEQFIKANNHLPEIPTESEVKQNGIGLGEMNAKLLQKIEELTLYMIQKDKESKLQAEQLKQQEESIKLMQQELEKLKNSNTNTNN